MKCPKCGYLGYEQVDRCRNCGYDFSLAPPLEFRDLPIREEQPSIAPLDDLALVPRLADPVPEPSAPSYELPLFVSTGSDEPLITKVSPPRTPLAVRRATPEVPRVRVSAAPRTPMLDLGMTDQPAAPASRPAAVRRAAVVADAQEAAAEPAGFGARFLAVAIDLVLLAAIDAAVIYLTIQICGLTVADLALLPKAPLVAFLALQNGGYLVSFTAGGQTIGKMASGIKVVSTREQHPPGLGDALLRTLVWFVLTVPAGLGLLTALLTPDRRGLHDRFAGTKVVRASA